MELFQPWHLILLSIISGLIALIYVVPLWLVAEKAGFNKWMAIVALLPLGVVVVLFYVALSKWHPKQV